MVIGSLGQDTSAHNDRAQSSESTARFLVQQGPCSLPCVLLVSILFVSNAFMLLTACGTVDDSGNCTRKQVSWLTISTTLLRCQLCRTARGEWILRQMTHLRVSKDARPSGNVPCWRLRQGHEPPLHHATMSPTLFDAQETEPHPHCDLHQAQWRPRDMKPALTPEVEVDCPAEREPDVLA